MDTHKADPPGATKATSPPATANNTGSQMRLIILLALLLLALGALGYDHFIAKPAVLEAYDKIQKLMDDTNSQSAAGTKRLTSDVIQQEIGKAPTKRIETEDYTVEYYCWWGPVPFLNTYRQYITVVLVGNEPRRLNSHYMNAYPPQEDLNPVYLEVLMDPGTVPGAESGEANEATLQEGGDPAADEGSERKSGKKGGKQRTKSEDADSVPGDAPASDEPASPEPSTTEPATTEPAALEPATSDSSEDRAKAADKDGQSP